jgi:hypothetical protein
MSKDKARIMTPAFRVAFPEVFKAVSYEGGDAKFSITMLFDKAEDLSALKRIASAAKKEKWGDDPPKNLRSPFRDADEEGKETNGYAGKIFVKASTKFQPGLVDAKRQPIIDETEFYAGCWARATVTAYAYSVKGNHGIAFNLGNVQKLKDDDSFMGGVSAADDFGAPEAASQSSDDNDEW